MQLNMPNNNNFHFRLFSNDYILRKSEMTDGNNFPVDSIYYFHCKSLKTRKLSLLLFFMAKIKLLFVHSFPLFYLLVSLNLHFKQHF